jgi:hypothetical protein
MRDHNYHYDGYHGRKPFPMGCLLIGLILLVVFGSKLMLCVPVVIFFLIIGGCFGGGGKCRRTVDVPYYDGDSYDRKRKNDFDDEDDITYV